VRQRSWRSFGQLDFDYVFIDGEHGPFDLTQLEDLCRTAERFNVTTIARVQPVLIVLAGGRSTFRRRVSR
jgi:2-keto-3-deoxy-L-rhamnonate aldolase RhmA